MSGSALFDTYARIPVSPERGEGSWLHMSDGDRYLDFSGGIAVNSLGHCHPHLVAALTEQAGKLWHTSNLFEIPGQRRLAERLAEHTFADKVFFTNSGAEALECAIKTARRYHFQKGQPERIDIITFEGAFHGRTLATIAAGGQAKYLEGFGPKAPGFMQVPFGDREALEIALVENLQRADLNAVEEARAFERLMGEFGHTQDVLAEAVGKSRSHVANTLRLLRLPEDVRLMVEDGRLTAGHGRALLGTSDPVALAHVVVEKSLTVREVEALAAAPPAARPTPPPPDPDLLACEERLARHLGLRVSIRPKRKGGSLSIAYSSPDQLQSLLDRLGSG